MAVKKKANSGKVEAQTKLSSCGKAKTMEKAKANSKAASKAGANPKVQTPEAVRTVNKISPPRISNGDNRKLSRLVRTVPPYTYMKAPDVMHDFQVGDKVEVYCDHEKGRERVRGWIAGIVVQVDNKMVAVQFRSNIYLTDGWMIPDRILWYPLTSDHIRSVAKKASRREKALPDY